VDATHPDLTGRVTSTDASGITTHATHVAGTILGNGTQSGGTYKGMAPLAQTLTRLWWNTASEMVSQYQEAILSYSAEVSNNSWGVGVTAPVSNSECEATLGNYFIEDATIDQVVRGGAGGPITIVWSAGNMRSTGVSIADHSAGLGIRSIRWRHRRMSSRLARSIPIITR